MPNFLLGMAQFENYVQICSFFWNQAMRLIATDVTDTAVLLVFADENDPRQCVNAHVPIEGWLKKLDRFFGVAGEPALQHVGDINKHTLAEVRKAALEQAQEILKERAARYKLSMR